MSINVAAIDLGASSGRVMLAKYNESSRLVKLKEVHRFPNSMTKKKAMIAGILNQFLKTFNLV